MELVIVSPLYNDWANLEALLRDLVRCLGQSYEVIRFVAVNDSSSEHAATLPVVPGVDLQVVNLTANYGHQRALIIGLCHVSKLQYAAEFAVIMDCDGEDRPGDVPLLLERCAKLQKPSVVFAERTQRSEGASFQLGYWFYRGLFRMLAGESIRFGNFSCLPTSLIPRLINDANFWNHYSAAVIRSNVPFDKVPTKRGRRYAGSSSMNFEKLTMHGISALSLYIDRIVFRLFRVLAIMLSVLIGAMFVIGYLRIFTNSAIPGWASMLIAALFNIIVTIGAFAFLVILQQLNRRNEKPEPPTQFFQDLILSIDHSTPVS